MEILIPRFNLGVPRIRGNDEYEMYKNYIKDLPRGRITDCLYTYFGHQSLKTKNNSKAAEAREQGNGAYTAKNYMKSLKLYTKSLRYATYNGDDYALALANRSAVYFSLDDYQNCTKDINLCLQANYPNHLLPKIYIRKAKCFQKLGESSEMRTTLIDALNVIDGLQSKFKSSIEKYKETIKELIIAEVCEKPPPTENFEVLPVLETNSKFRNASSSVMLKYSKQKGCHVVAKKEIAVGDVLFVEKAYAFQLKHIDKGTDIDEHCQYCLLKLNSCVPCKTCVKHVYCTEKCRDAAWNEFHQWECIAIQAGFHTCCADLAFRIILKTINKGFSTCSVDIEDMVNNYGDEEDNYLYIYNLPYNLGQVDSNFLQLYVSAAALLVHYLKLKTNFFQTMKKLTKFAEKSVKELMAIIGGLILRHCCQAYFRFVPIWDFDNEYCVPNEVTIGTAICSSITMMQHSCIPNTGFYFVGDSIVVKAANNIKVNEDITYLYCGVPFSSLEKNARKKTLQKFGLMKCKCPLCTDPKVDTYTLRNCYLCTKCKGSSTSIVDSNNYFTPQLHACLDCNYKFKLPLNVTLVENEVRKLFRGVIHYCNIEDADLCIEISKTIYSPYHDTIQALYIKRQEYYRLRGNIRCFIENSLLLLRSLEHKRDGPAVKVGRDSYTYCVTALDMLERVALKINLQEFREVLRMLSILVEKAKFVFNLHHAPFFARIQTVEKRISAFQDIYYNLCILSTNKM